jgi:hypothetical protein
MSVRIRRRGATTTLVTDRGDLRWNGWSAAPPDVQQDLTAGLDRLAAHPDAPFHTADSVEAGIALARKESPCPQIPIQQSATAAPTGLLKNGRGGPGVGEVLQIADQALLGVVLLRPGAPRDGRLVADTTPDELRERTGEQEMESAFLRLVEETAS